MAPRLGLLALLAAGALLLPTAAAGLEAHPTPIPAGGTATVEARFPAPVEEADLRACQADGTRAILSCYPPAEMTRGDGGNWTATVPPSGGFAEVASAGLNATGTTDDGRTLTLPANGTYRFVAVAPAEASNGVPGPDAVLALAAGAVAALTLRRRGQP